MVQQVSHVYFITGKHCLEIINSMILFSFGGFFSLALKLTQSHHIANHDTQIRSSNKAVKQGGEINLNYTSLVSDAHRHTLHEKRGLSHVKPSYPVVAYTKL